MAVTKGVLLVPVAAAIAALTVANTVSAAHTSTPANPDSLILAKLIPPLVKALPDRKGVVVVLGTSFLGSADIVGTILWFERIGITARTFDTPYWALGRRRVHEQPSIRTSERTSDAR